MLQYNDLFTLRIYLQLKQKETKGYFKRITEFGIEYKRDVKSDVTQYEFQL